MGEQTAHIWSSVDTPEDPSDTDVIEQEVTQTTIHTGGSIGFEEHCLKLKELTGEDPSFIDLYYKTHLTAKSKKIYFGGDKEAPVDFVNETSRVAIESYNKALSQKYGDDPT
ncbi:unnamed protein product [Lactuca virosa]|uniref:Uncharacterized protein n=1 Tax=Lactuca virosa TaxID=75947 RepID=A0AAU9NSS0_9ASTR|nr:unnamed protein product [Lactuca virosa]